MVNRHRRGEVGEVGDHVNITGDLSLPLMLIPDEEHQVLVREDNNTAKKHHPQLAKQCHHQKNLDRVFTVTDTDTPGAPNTSSTFPL